MNFSWKKINKESRDEWKDNLLALLATHFFKNNFSLSFQIPTIVLLLSL